MPGALLTAYMDLARTLWTDDLRAQVRLPKAEGGIGKAWLTDELIDVWGLGVSPTLPAMLRAGLKELDLMSVGLVAEDPSGRRYPFFRNSLMIPYFEKGKIVYVSSRRLSDLSPAGEPLPKDKKCLSMLSPPRGVKRPCGFNLDLLDDAQTLLATGLCVVEAPLEALYCTGHEHFSVGFLGGRLSSNHRLLERLAALHHMGVHIYYMPDGTPDVTPELRLTEGSAIGPYTHICTLP